MEAGMDLLKIMRNIELFEGLTDSELEEIAAICVAKRLKKGDILVEEGAPGESFFIITGGAVEVVVNSAFDTSRRAVLNLGAGQLIGEMSLVEQSPRSATVAAIEEPTTVQAIRYDDFHRLCERNTRIGYITMRNMAADISFKLRHFNLSR
jgi:CRP-like cAMP-binding protein